MSLAPLCLAYELHAALNASHRRLGLTFADFRDAPELSGTRTEYLRAADAALKAAASECDMVTDHLVVDWRNAASHGASLCAESFRAARRKIY